MDIRVRGLRSAAATAATSPTQRRSRSRHQVQHTRQGSSEHPARRPPPPRAPLPSEQATAWSSRLGLPPQPAAPDRASRGEQIRPNDILGTADINYPIWVSSSSTTQEEAQPAARVKGDVERVACYPDRCPFNLCLIANTSTLTSRYFERTP